MTPQDRITAINQQLGRIEKVLEDWDAHEDAAHRVGRLEMPTMLVNEFEREKGYHREKALLGYQQMIRAFQAVDDDMTDAQRRGLDRVVQTIARMAIDFELSGGRRPTAQIVDEFATAKVRELERHGEIYLPSGHVRHFNISLIRKTADGYTFTIYDAGHETETVRMEDDRQIIHSVREYSLKKDADIISLIKADVLKRSIDHDSPDYIRLKQAISSRHESVPIRVVEDYGQRRGNCTTRGQRILIADIMQDPSLCERMYDFITDVDENGQSNVKSALIMKRAALQELKRGLTVGLIEGGMIGDIRIFARAANPAEYQSVTVTLDSGAEMNIYRTRPGAFSREELDSLKKTLQKNGVSSWIRRSTSQQGQFYLYVPEDKQDDIAAALARDDSPAAKLYSLYGAHAPDVETLQVASMAQNYETNTRSGQFFFRTKPGLFSHNQLVELAQAVNDQDNGHTAYIRESAATPGKYYMGIDIGPEHKVADMVSMVSESFRQARGIDGMAVNPVTQVDFDVVGAEKSSLGNSFSQAVRNLGGSLAAMLPSFARSGPQRDRGSSTPG